MLYNTHMSGDAKVTLMFIKYFESLGYKVQALFLILFAGYCNVQTLLSCSKNMFM